MAPRLYALVAGCRVWEDRAPEKTMTGTCQAGSSLIFLRMKKRRCSPRRCMKGVPGVMQLESKASGPAASSPLLSFSFSSCTDKAVTFQSLQQ